MSGKPNGDRRAERRQETVEEILDVAWRLARTEGLAGLSLREIAREVGMRPQSLYTYFASKNAIYDAMFAQGCREFASGQPRGGPDGDEDLRAGLTRLGRYFLDFCVADPVRYQLLFQRTLPGFEPSAESFAISVESLAVVQDHLVALGIDDPRDLDLFTALGSGLAAQQIANEPDGDRWLRLLDDAIAMFIQHVSAPGRREGATPS